MLKCLLCLSLSWCGVLSGRAQTAYYINAGGTQPYTDALGRTFSPDDHFTDGRTYSNLEQVQQTDDGAMFRSERYGEFFSYALPIAPGTYVVDLYFAEIFHNRAGRRVFDVDIEGQEFLDRYDIFAKAGKNSATYESMEVTVTDGTLNITFDSRSAQHPGNAKVSAIVVRQPGTDTEPVLKIASPLNGSAFLRNVPVTFRAAANDVEDRYIGDSVYWYLDDQLIHNGGTFTRISETLGEGPHTLTARLADSDGNTASQTISLEIIPNTAPTVRITGPGIDLPYPLGTNLTFVATARDAEDGNMNTLIRWASDLDGDLGTGATLSKQLGAGQHNVTASVTDVHGVTTIDTAIVRVLAPMTVPFYINAGSEEAAQIGNMLWQSDTLYATLDSRTFRKPTRVRRGFLLTPIYQQERFNVRNLSYAFPVANGSYSLNLLFAEIWLAGLTEYDTAFNNRQFHVAVEGDTIFNALDLLAMTGKDFPVAVDLPVQNIEVTDGVLNLDFLIIAGKNFPKINGIAVCEGSRANCMDLPLTGGLDVRDATPINGRKISIPTADVPVAGELQVYPNPFTAEIAFALPPDADPTARWTTELLSVQGRLLLRAEGPVETLEANLNQRLERLPAGLYQLLIHTPEGVVTQRLVKQ